MPSGIPLRLCSCHGSLFALSIALVPTACSVQQIKVLLRALDGVAYTTGTATHKEIHLSLDHIARSKDRAGDEARGVITHEMVHCFQHNGTGKAPSGLIEGIAGSSNVSPAYIDPKYYYSNVRLGSPLRELLPATLGAQTKR